MCIMDCNPTVLKILHNSPEFMPYVVFLQAPGAGDIQQQGQQLCISTKKTADHIIFLLEEGSTN